MSMVSHHDLHGVLTNSAINFNGICISETSQQKDEVFPQNEKFVNYDSFCTSTKSSKGGVAIFCKEIQDTFEREDLKICDEEYEQVWKEI